MTGRRIYLHEQSLNLLARSDLGTAKKVARLQQAAQARKIFHHHVIDQGVEYGLIRSEAVTALASEIDALVVGDFTDLLRGVGHRPRKPDQRDNFDRVVGWDEHVVASCYESGYFTFATDEASSQRMYNDHRRLKSLWREFMEGEAPEDLTMIKGQALAMIDKDDGTGVGLGYLYQLEIDRLDIDEDHLRQVRIVEARSFVSVLQRALIDNWVADQTPSEERLVREALTSIARCLLANKLGCSSSKPAG